MTRGMNVLLWSCLLVGCTGVLRESSPEPLDWWQTTVFYQIYPRSFQDSNGDGTGDLNGITARLDHIKELGVGAMWLSPIFKSPMADFGYDIADYKMIDPLFGTIEDFDKLIEKAKALDIKVILDFVPNHSSDESEWFQKSVQGDPQYKDYFIWRDPKGMDEQGNPIPPNNWLSVFFGSAWKWNEQRQQFYLHQFDPKQPDLNYRNPKLVQEMKDVLTFWLDHGVSGFRCDAVPFLFEDVRELDEPLSNLPGSQPDDTNYLNHVYTQNQPETYDMIEQWRELLDQYSKKDNVTRVMMTEAYAPLNDTMRYYGTEDRRGAHFTFNFNFITSLNASSHAQDFSDQIDLWLDNMPKWAWPNWVIGNHDNHRVASRYGSDLADGMNMLVMVLPGTGVTYNGEEIAMVDAVISYNDTQDPQGCNAGPDRYESYSRDPERTPFQWDDTLNAGFSTAAKTWLPVNPNYMELNLEAQKPHQSSHYNVYRSMVKLRSWPELQYGSLVKAVVENTLILGRVMPDGTFSAFLINFDHQESHVDLTKVLERLPSTLVVYEVSGNSPLQRGSSVNPGSVTVAGRTGMVLRTAQE